MAHCDFDDPPALAVLVNRDIVRGNAWTAYVSHDADDGGWQFHNASRQALEKDVMVISLREMLDLDPSLAELHDLPLGWYAWREQKDGKWHRSPS